jgi:AcrR family transcriptional regulator
MTDSQPTLTDVSDGTVPGTAKPYHHGNLRAAMVASALALIESSGPGDLSLRRAARDIGVSQTAPLYHFGNKFGLLVAVATEGFRMLLAHRRTRVEGQTGARNRLRAAMLAYVEFGVAHPALFRLMTGPDIRTRSSDPDLELAAGETIASLRDCMADYLVEIGQPIELAHRASLAAWATSHGIVTILLDRENSPLLQPRRDPTVIADEIIDIMIAGLGQMGVPLR